MGKLLGLCWGINSKLRIHLTIRFQRSFLKRHQKCNSYNFPRGDVPGPNLPPPYPPHLPSYKGLGTLLKSKLLISFTLTRDYLPLKVIKSHTLLGSLDQ